MQIGNLKIDKMRVTVTDQTVKPAYHSKIDPLNFTASDVHWPGPAAKGVKLDAQGLEGAKLSITGDVAPGGSVLTAKLDGLPLAQLHPYAAGAGYGLAGGTFTLDSKIKLGADSYDTKNKLVVHKLQVTGSEGDALFASEFGMPLSLALGLMTDLQGNIVLNVPVAGDRSGTRVAIASIIRDTLARAILNAATSPLKLIGAVANIGEKPASLTPQPIAFRTGTEELVKDEEAKIKQLGSLLSSSQSIGLRLRAEASADDRRFLAEQKLKAVLEGDKGFLGSIKNLGERGERAAALEVLTKRAAGESATIPAEYEKWFEEQVATQKVSDDELRALAKRRAEAVRAALVSAQASAAERVAIDDPATEDLAARSVVAITLGTNVASAKK